MNPLLAADEGFTHQIAATFARVSQSDRAWTEKLWAMAASADGTLSLAFGLGKYVNRNVMDAFAGVSRGAEQWTVRASRRLSPEPERTAVGPIRYEVVEPLRRARFVLEPNDVVPVAFDWELRGVVPPAVEEQEVHTSRSRYRIDAEVVRFHHIGVASGWVDVEGERTEIDEGSWVSARDRSWGVRYAVGAPPEDVEPTPRPPGTAGLFVWMPATMRPAGGGDPYGLFVFHQRYSGPGWSTGSSQGAIERADGSRTPFRDIVPDLRFRDDNRRLVGGTIRCDERVYEIVPLSDTGFHLGAGLYGGFDGHWHGEWRGKLHVEGEHITACDDPDVARRLHQHRDCIVRVRDVETGDEGIGSLQSTASGPHPEIGLTEEASFD